MAFIDTLEKYVDTLLNGGLMTAEETEADITSLVEAWVVLKYTKERLETRLKSIRKELLTRAEEFGVDTEKGGNKLSVDGTLVLRERRQASLPDEQQLKKLLSEHNVKPDQAFSKVTTTVLDASKIKVLVDLGKLPEAEVEALRKVTWALRVKESYDLAEALERAVGEPGKEGIKEKAPRDKRTEANGNRKGD